MITFLLFNYIIGLILVVVQHILLARKFGGLWAGCQIVMLDAGMPVPIDTVFKVAFFAIGALVAPHVALWVHLYKMLRK